MEQIQISLSCTTKEFYYLVAQLEAEYYRDKKSNFKIIVEMPREPEYLASELVPDVVGENTTVLAFLYDPVLEHNCIEISVEKARTGSILRARCNTKRSIESVPNWRTFVSNLTSHGWLTESRQTIASQNQRGGITAHTVNINGGFHQNTSAEQAPIKKNALVRIIVVITGIVTFLAALLKILEYFKIFPF